MPCLNEAETLETCIQKANRFLLENNIIGEVLIADNGSTDGSQEIAINNGARVARIATLGYGAALIGGSLEARGKYVIMGDADDSYDFLNLMPFVEKLREGYELVMGNRFKGGIEKGAMPPLHKYLGNPVLSFIGRLFYPSEIGDFHCGLRGYHRKSMLELELQTTGMEYASEMVVKATLSKFKMTEVATTLAKDGRSRAPHLRSFRDGWRHLKFLLMHSPKWLFLFPGIAMFFIGLIGEIVLAIGPIKVGRISFDIHTLLYASMLMLVGFQFIMFSLFTTIFARNSKFIPIDEKIDRMLEKVTTEKGALVGSILCVLGFLSTCIAFFLWQQTSFGNLAPQVMMRITIPALSSIVIGVQMIFGSFFVGILNIKHQ